MRDYNYYFIGIFLLTASACVTTGVRPTAPPEQGVYLDHLNEQAKSSADWFIDSDEERIKLQETYKGSVSPELATYLEKDVYLVQDKQIERYHRQILDRLLSAWQGEKPRISLLFESDDNLNAYVDVHNQIHVSTGLLRSVENEDQLASVLAHEVSHVLLKHNQQKSAAQVMPWSIEMAGALSVAAAGVAYNEKKEEKYLDYAEKALIGSQSLGMAWSDMLAPSWSRSYEREADKLGMDLLMKAGYNYEEFYSTIGKLHETSLRRSARQEFFMKLALAALEESKDEFYGDDPDDKVDKVLGDIKTLAASSFAALTFDTIARGNVGHDTREQRIEALKLYVDAAHDGGELPPETEIISFNKALREGPGKKILDADLAAIDIIKALNQDDIQAAKRGSQRLGWGFNGAVTSVGIAQSSYKTTIQRQSKKAISTLQRVTRSELAPAEAYIKLSELYLLQNDAQAAARTLELGTSRIGRNYRFLPGLIAAHRMAGDTEQAEAYAVQCLQHNNEEGLNLAQIALASAKKDTGNYYTHCSRKLGYDVIAKRNQEAKQQARQLRKTNPDVQKASEKLDNMIRGLFSK